MSRYGYAAGALLGFLFTAFAIFPIVLETEEMPGIVSVWPLVAAIGTSLVTWWLQGLIVAVLARPRLKSLRVGDMFSIYMAGTFVAGISPIRGAEIPYEVGLLRRLGLSAGEGSTVVVTRVLLDAAILTLGALGGLALTSELPELRDPELLLAGLAIFGISAALICLVRRRMPARRELYSSGSDGWTRVRTKLSGFCEDVRSSLALFWRRGYRATLIYGGILTILYWAMRLAPGPLALMAVGWSGDWIPVIVSQVLLVSIVLPLAPTPGGSGARELSLAALLSPHVPEDMLLSGIVVYTGLTYCLPVFAGALFASRQFWREVVRGGEGQSGCAGAGSRVRHRTRVIL